ncbi:MAG: antibiotic biosynthesis monooxygenase [Anaerolineales bacterium]|nr:antibiotic biosynthesis monooxygenase [Anaerolineales bacterium]
MVVIRVQVTVKPEEQTNFVAHLTQEAAEVQTWPGCKQFQLYQDVTAEHRYLLYEEWESLESFDHYRHSEQFKTNGAKLFPMMADKPNSAYFTAEQLEG